MPLRCLSVVCVAGSRGRCVVALFRRRRGAAAVLAMLYLLLFVTLGTAMFTMASMNVQTADNLTDADKARASAESGLRWMAWRFTKMARPKTTIGNITSSVADTLWPSIRTAVTNDFALMMTPAERTVNWDGTNLTSTAISTDSAQGKFTIAVRQHPIGASDTLDKRYVRVTSTGTYGNATRTVFMDFKIDKKVKFAIVGKVPIQIGRNTIVEGPIAMTTPNKYPPILQLSDFRHLTAALQTKIDNFNTFLGAHHIGYDNRISVFNPTEMAAATTAGYTDYNGDSYIDEYDIFLKEFDKNGDKAISKAEFTNPATSKLYDTDLFTAMDSLGAPMYAGDSTRAGYQDGMIDNRDAYTKVRGQISLASTANAWSTSLGSSGKISDYIQGPIQADDGAIDPAIKFGVDPTDIFDLSPTNFDTSTFRAKTGPENGTTVTTKGNVTNATPLILENRVLSATDTQVMQVTAKGNTTFAVGDIVLKADFDAANAPLASNKKATGTNISQANATEHTPFGSTSWQATYVRPVFKNVKFRNVRIPKGLNAMFDGCTFEGVTYVELTTAIKNASNQTTTSASDGMTWSQRMKSGSFSSSTALSTTNSKGFDDGNNLRFNNCVINGPVASDVPTAYTHFSNSWEFTGATLFNNTADQTATMVCPQTNIEMGSFTDPSQAPSTLVGVVVAGNIDIRGSSYVDGSIIVTGDGAGNTTQGWFGPSDASTDVTTPMPEGGYGHLNIRYNPYRALPDGINIAIDILPDITTYGEGQ